MIRNIVIGIDGGCFESIQPLLSLNLLPNFKKLIENGFSAHLQVTIPHQTIPSWPCLFSGQSVDQLGYYTFIHPEKGIFNSTVWKDEAILSIKELKVFALNIPGAYPAWKINGEIISGILSPSISCFPKELEIIIRKNWIVEGKNISEIFKAFDMKKRLFLRKLKEDFDLLVFVIRVPDALSHRVIGDKKTISGHINYGYKKIDDFLGEIIKQNNYDNLIIFSDHGLKFYKKVFNFPRWLEKNRLLYLNYTREKKLNSIILKLYDFIRPFMRTQFSKKIYGKFFDVEEREKQLRKDKGFNSFDKNNPHTFIQKLTSNMGALFLSGKDKYKKEKIKHALSSDKDIVNVIEYNKDGFPDFIIALKDNYVFTKEPSFFLKRRTEAFSHTNRGLFIASGKSIRKGKENLINFQDIAPTILKLYKIDKPDYMKGKILDIINK
ncbi:MAG: alkaline phosphatase family protein [Candidatus Hermodarchaeota archaeon]